jgi:hypothetical protein
MPHEPELWRGKGLPPAVEALMTEGARIGVTEEVGFEEVPQYAWPTDEALMEGILSRPTALSRSGRWSMFRRTSWRECSAGEHGASVDDGAAGSQVACMPRLLRGHQPTCTVGAVCPADRLGREGGRY